MGEIAEYVDMNNCGVAGDAEGPGAINNGPWIVAFANDSSPAAAENLVKESLMRSETPEGRNPSTSRRHCSGVLKVSALTVTNEVDAGCCADFFFHNLSCARPAIL